MNKEEIVGPMAKISKFIWVPLLSLLPATAFSEQGTAWDYKLNGANWGSIGQCGSSAPQSPINLPLDGPVDDELKLFLKYPKLDTAFTTYNNGYSVAFTLPESYKGGFGLGSELADLDSEDASAYRLWQVNFHSPSEHTINGVRMPLEMQMMHQRVTGGNADTAVVVVLFSNAANTYVDFLDKLMPEGLPEKPWEEKTIMNTIEFSDVVGGSPFYHYDGSLTVPPCESHVKYYVRQEPIPAATPQLRRFQKVLKETCGPKGNFRNVHPIQSPLVLVPSVDVVKAPDKVVNPTPKEIKKKENPAPAGVDVGADGWACPEKFYDEELKHIGRIRVGESPEFVVAKEKYNRAMRELQVADGQVGAAQRNWKLQEGLYKNAPGLVDKINAKWALDGAKAVYEGAKGNVLKYINEKDAEEEAIWIAIEEECWRQLEAKEEDEVTLRIRTGKVTTKAIAKHQYSEPKVSLPRGLAASPFSSKVGSSEAIPAKISPNMNQPDLAPSGLVSEAVLKKEPKIAKKVVPEEIVVRIRLPIATSKIADKAAFEKELGEALAASGDISPDRIEVKDPLPIAIAKVHQSPAPDEHGLKAELVGFVQQHLFLGR